MEFLVFILTGAVALGIGMTIDVAVTFVTGRETLGLVVGTTVWLGLTFVAPSYIMLQLNSKDDIEQDLMDGKFRAAELRLAICFAVIGASIVSMLDMHTGWFVLCVVCYALLGAGIGCHIKRQIQKKLVE